MDRPHKRDRALPPWRRARGNRRRFEMKRTIACLAFAIAVVAPSVAQGASPVQGAWQGTQARWNGGNGWKTTLPFPVAFSLKGGTVVGFTETGGHGTVPSSGGQSVAAPPPGGRGGQGACGGGTL